MKRLRVGKGLIDLVQTPFPLHPDLVGAVDQDVRHLGVPEKGLDRPQAEHAIHDEPGALGASLRSFDVQEPGGLCLYLGLAKRDDARGDLAGDAIDHAHGISQTLSQAPTQRLLRGTRPRRRSLTTLADSAGSTGPGPGGFIRVRAGCQTAGIGSTGMSSPGSSGRTGTTGQGHCPR